MPVAPSNPAAARPPIGRSKQLLLHSARGIRSTVTRILLFVNIAIRVRVAAGIANVNWCGAVPQIVQWWRFGPIKNGAALQSEAQSIRKSVDSKKALPNATTPKKK